MLCAQDFDGSVLPPILTGTKQEAKASSAAAFARRFLQLREQVSLPLTDTLACVLHGKHQFASRWHLAFGISNVHILNLVEVFTETAPRLLPAGWACQREQKRCCCTGAGGVTARVH